MQKQMMRYDMIQMYANELYTNEMIRVIERSLVIEYRLLLLTDAFGGFFCSKHAYHLFILHLVPASFFPYPYPLGLGFPSCIINHKYLHRSAPNAQAAPIGIDSAVAELTFKPIRKKWKRKGKGEKTREKGKGGRDPKRAWNNILLYDVVDQNHPTSHWCIISSHQPFPRSLTLSNYSHYNLHIHLHIL